MLNMNQSLQLKVFESNLQNLTSDQKDAYLMYLLLQTLVYQNTTKAYLAKCMDYDAFIGALLGYVPEDVPINRQPSFTFYEDFLNRYDVKYTLANPLEESNNNA